MTGGKIRVYCGDKRHTPPVLVGLLLIPAGGGRPEPSRPDRLAWRTPAEWHPRTEWQRSQRREMTRAYYSAERRRTVPHRGTPSLPEVDALDAECPSCGRRYAVPSDRVPTEAGRLVITGDNAHALVLVNGPAGRYRLR